jgi:ABC-2 type transport system ATP-binding protein
MNVSCALGSHCVAAGHVVDGLGPGFFLPVVLVIAAAGYGVTRLGRRRRGARVEDSTWRHERQGPSPTDATAPPGDGAGAPGTAGPSSPQLNREDFATRSPELAASEKPAHRATFAEPAPLGHAPAAARPARAVDLLGRSAGGWAVETHGLIKRFGANAAVDNVELLVPRGSAFGYLGPNGAGKTTLIRTLLGLTRADAGTMSLLGIRVPAERSRALARVGAIVDEPRFHHHLTGRENLRLLGAARGGKANGRIPGSLARVGLTDRADDKVASYSMGMRQRLGVAACLLGDPELLILDEPMNGLDPAGMHEMRAVIRSLVDEGRTVMLSSHLLDEVERTCDAVAIVDHGRVIRQGPIDELVRSAGARIVRLDCSDPAAAGRVLELAGLAAGVALGELVLTVTLPADASRETVAEVNRRLVEGGISVSGQDRAVARARRRPRVPGRPGSRRPDWPAHPVYGADDRARDHRDPDPGPHRDPVLPQRPATGRWPRHGPTPARGPGGGHRRRRWSGPRAVRRARIARHTTDAHLGDDHRDRRLDRRLVGDRRMADGHPRRLTTPSPKLCLA